MNAATTRRLTITAGALAILLGGSVALAGQGYRPGRERGPGKGLRAALATLDLTDAQKEQLQKLFEAERARRATAREEGRAAREALREAAGAARPDPAGVGTAYLRLESHHEAMRVERAAARERFEAVLTAEQKAKLEGWKEARREMRGGPFRHGGRGQGRPGPPSFD